MKPKGIELERTLHNQQQDLLLQQLFTGGHVPESLVGMVRNFQEAWIAQGIEDKLNFKESLVKRCEIQIGTLHLDLTVLDEEKVRKCLEVCEQIEKSGDKEQASGQIAWQFSGVNQFGAVTIRVKERSWQIEFSRLQRRISAFITDEAALKPKAHQALYEEMKKTLRPIASSEPSQLLILQGAPGLGKSHCTEHYFYHEANKHHQMVAWLSGKSKEDFLRDWEALANQLRVIDIKRKDDSDTVLIRHWCEEQLGQWLFIVDDLQMEIDWLKQYLPQKGGHVLITTAQPLQNLPQKANIFSFSPLSSEDSKLLLKAWLGKYWEAAGFAKEVQALNYFSEALGGSPALLTQIALLVRKKGLSFERAMGQFQDAKTRSLLLADTVFDQLKGQTFLECAKKSWWQCVVALGNHYPQLTYPEHEVHLKQFIGFLKQHVGKGLEEKPQVYVDEELILTYWQGVWASLSCVPLDEEQIAACLNLLPLSYDKVNQQWAVSLAGLHALACQGGEKDLSPALPTVTTIRSVPKRKLDLPQMSSGISLSMGLENSSLSYAEIALFTTDKPAEFTAWRLPTTNPYFIPRPALTDEITEKLPHKATREQSAELALAAASGMGGIGKTELARHFITTPELSSHYKKRFWFNAESATALRNEFHDLASYLGLIEPKEYLENKVLIQRLHRWFNLNSGWLMVLDNADEYNAIAKWIPKEGGAVLITTREPTPGKLIDEQIIKVPLLTQDEAISWLYRLAQRNQNATTETEQKAARELVDNLGYLPLAIAQVAAYLREQKAVSIEEYQKNFLELLLKDESLIERNETIENGSDAYSRRVIASTWRLSLERIEASVKEKGLFNACPWLLAACSYLAPKDIPLGLLECWFKAFFNLENISLALLSYLVDEYTAQLFRYSLCERAGLTSRISMHRLVQEVLRSILIKEPNLLTRQEVSMPEIKHLDEKLAQKCIVKEEIFPSISEALVEYSAEFDLSIADRKRRIDLISHLQMIITTWEMPNCQGKINPEILIMLYGVLGEVQLELRADAKEGLMLYQKQLGLGEKYHGPEHPETAAILVNLGNAYEALGDVQQQKTLLERALSIIERHYGSKSLEIAKVLTNLSNTYCELGDAQQQKNLLERALSILEWHYGSEHPFLANTLMNLGIAYGILGDTQQKKNLLERALHIKEQHYTPEHPEVALLLANLGNAYGVLGDAQQQKRLLERALRIKEGCYSSEHPAVAITLMNLGNAYGALGNAQQQKKLQERALYIDEQHYGPDHPRIARTLINLSIAQGALGDVQQQKNLLERALLIFEQHYSSEHIEVASTLMNLGRAYSALGDAQQAKIVLERALHIMEQHYGSEHPDVAGILMNLGIVHGILGDAQQKKNLLERALPIFERHYGPEHPGVARALANLGFAYAALGNVQQGKILLERALPILEQYYGPEHPTVASTLAVIGNAYGKLGDVQQQKKLLKRALPILEQHYGPEHPEVAQTLMNLGNAYGDLRNAQQQKNLLERALPILERYYGSEHLEVAKALENLGDAYGVLGNAQQQKHLLTRVLHIEERYYGPEHPTVARALTKLGNAYSALGDTQQQKNLLERALPILENHYGPEHPEVAFTLADLGVVYGELGDVKQKKVLLERILPIMEHHYGPQHLHVATTLMNLGNAYGALGDSQQKKSLLERALHINEHCYGFEHPEVAKTLTNLGNAYGALGDAQQQKSLQERALRIKEHYYGPNHPEVAITLINLGNAYRTLGDVEQQKNLLERALPIFEQHYGSGHPHVASILVILGNAYSALKGAEQQNILLPKVSTHHAGSALYTAAHYKQMGDSLLSYEQPLKAISYYEKALKIDPEFQGVRHNLACCYHIQGEIEEADACFQIGIALSPTPGLLAEYAHFLVKQRRFQESLSFIEQCLQATTQSRLNYDISAYSTVLPAIQNLIDKHPSHFVELSAQGLAHYLQVLYYQECQQQEQAQEAIKRFELWMAQQTDAQQQEIFQFLKNSLVFEAESIALNLLSSEQQFFQAVEAGNLNLIQTIIEKQNVSIDWQEPASQRTALHLTCISQQRDIIACLLAKMARFDIKDKEGKLAWEYIINTPLLELFKTTSALFTQKYFAALNAGIFLDWDKVLRMAVASDYLADVRFLIEVKGIDINSVDANPKTRYTALHLAVIKNKPEVASYLVFKGADINVLDASHKIPGDYVTPEQKELLALFNLPAKNTSVEECGSNFERLHL